MEPDAPAAGRGGEALEPRPVERRIDEFEHRDLDFEGALGELLPGLRRVLEPQAPRARNIGPQRPLVAPEILLVGDELLHGPVDPLEVDDLRLFTPRTEVLVED